MDNNFKVRVIVGVSLFVVALAALYTFDAIPFKILFGLFAFISAVELLSFFKRRHKPENYILAFLELVFLICSVYFVSQIDVDHFW